MANNDPIHRIAKQRIVQLSIELEVQFSNTPGGGPCIEILRVLRDRATESLVGLAFLNIHDEKDRLTYITLQNEVKRYDEWLGAMKEIIVAGRQLDQQMTEEDREELREFLFANPDGERELMEMGLIDPPPRGTE
jgi:hypothetical protein